MRKRVETHGFQLQQMRGDLFTCPRSEALAHCISEDCQIGAGIATLVREKFSGVQDLLSQKRKAGECVVLNQGNRFVYYLVTKGKSHQKPSCGSLWKSLEAMRNHCIAKGVTSVSMPRTGCGLDHLEWKRVLGIIKDVFKDTDIHITVAPLFKENLSPVEQSPPFQRRRACISATERPQAVLTQEPAWTQMYESESVTLRCQVQGGYTDWRFTWYKAGRNAPVTQDYYSSIYGDRFTISSATGDHSGEYTCKGERRGNPPYSKTSDALTLRVSELFSTPTLTVLPGASVWEGEAVTLQCGAHINKQGTQLQYRYSKDNGTVRGAGSQDQHSIPAAGLRDTGRYQCEVEAAGTGLKKRSASVSLTVRAGRPKPALSREGRGGEIFEGDTVTLSCSVQPYSTGWRYLWYKDRQGAPVYQTDSSSGTGAGYTISAAAL
ncbi:Fc receptor-like protein 5 [Huso huso]|uniref:Fc receptor-like protein 5 n=1 Tax=Huso huso TaxID=61971 RepID=A0ABR0Z018_HUSHU